MLIKIKVFTIGLGITALASALFSFTKDQDDEKKKKYHVIHQKDGEMKMYDTILPMSSNYSVENFLADKGIENENVEIIKIPSMDNMMLLGEEMAGESRVMIKEFKHDIEIDGEESESNEVKIMVEMDDDGNKVVKKWVDGEEVEMTDEELKKMEMHRGMHRHHGHHGERVIVVDGNQDGSDERVEIKVEIDDEGNKVIKKTVNGEEVEVTEAELEEMHDGMKGEHMIIKMDIDTHGDHKMTFDSEDGEEVRIEVEMDDDGNKSIKKWVNGEEVEMTEEERNRIENDFNHDGHGGKMMRFQMGDSNMTEEEKEELIREMKEGMSELRIQMDSLHGELDFNIETILEEIDIDGAEGNVFIHRIETDGDHECSNKCEGKCDHHKMRKMHRMHGSDEDFTIVLVHENLSDQQVELQNEEQREMMSNEGDMIVFPNPNEGVFTIQFEQSDKVKTKIEIVDAQGKVVFSDKLGKFSGEYRKEINLKEHGAGMYIVTIQQGDQLNSHKVMVK